MAQFISLKEDQTNMDILINPEHVSYLLKMERYDPRDPKVKIVFSNGIEVRIKGDWELIKKDIMKL